MDAELRRARSQTLGVGLVAIVLVAAAVAGALSEPNHARGQERNFAGSVQAAYMVVPTDPEQFSRRDRAFQGFTTELALKLAIDFDDHISGAVKVCYGCHGFEVDTAHIDLRLDDALNVRVGRFNPTFGDLPLRHDPANHRTVDKPLPYDMGRMLRLREWNLGVLPSPYVDHGVEVNGTTWLGDSLQVDYAVYAVSGLRGNTDDVDIDFTQSRSPSSYYIDNNASPTLGGRLALTLDASLDASFTFGVSGMFGRYDPESEREYLVAGADLYARLGLLELRAEYLLRYTEMALSEDPFSRFKYGPGSDGRFDDAMVKDGFYLEGVYVLGSRVEALARVDGLRRFGNVLASSPLRRTSAVVRYTAGANFLVGTAVRLKVTGEFYDFTDFDDEFVLALGVVAVL